MMSDKVKVKILTGFLVLTYVGIGIYFVREKNLIPSSSPVESIVTDCVQEEEFLLEDEQLTGIAAMGSKLKFYRGYYACNPLRRGDIVVLTPKADAKPVARVVQAIEGDQIDVLPYPLEDAFTLRINGTFLMGPDGKTPQKFGVGQWNVKQGSTIHESFRAGKISLNKDQFLVLSIISPARNDSSEFGPINSSQILGRAVPVTPN